MITTRKIYKTPLCVSCTFFINVKYQDDMILTLCGYDDKIKISPENLATECSKYNDKLKEKYWELLEQQTREIPIIGEKKPVKAGFKLEDFDSDK